MEALERLEALDALEASVALATLEAATELEVVRRRDAAREGKNGGLEGGAANGRDGVLVLFPLAQLA